MKEKDVLSRYITLITPLVLLQIGAINSADDPSYSERWEELRKQQLEEAITESLTQKEIERRQAEEEQMQLERAIAASLASAATEKSPYQQRSTHLEPSPEPIIVNLRKSRDAENASLKQAEIQQQQQQELENIRQQLKKEFAESCPPQKQVDLMRKEKNSTERAIARITQGVGAQITEQLPGGPFPAFRILAPNQNNVISCGLHALANLHTIQTLLPDEDAKIDDVTPYTNFVTISQKTNDKLEQKYGCPKEQLQLADLIEYSHSSEFAVRNLYAFRYDSINDRLIISGSGIEYYDVADATFPTSVQQFLQNTNDSIILNILLQTGSDQDSGHWTAASIIKTATMPEPILIFMDSLSNNIINQTTRTNPSYRRAIQAVQKAIIDPYSITIPFRSSPVNNAGLDAYEYLK